MRTITREEKSEFSPDGWLLIMVPHRKSAQETKTHFVMFQLSEPFLYRVNVTTLSILFSEEVNT